MQSPKISTKDMILGWARSVPDETEVIRVQGQDLWQAYQAKRSTGDRPEGLPRLLRERLTAEPSSAKNVAPFLGWKRSAP